MNRTRVARLNADGSLDPSFTGAPLTGEINALALLASGRLLAGGYITNSLNPSSPLLIRLTSDGLLDETFNLGSGVEVSPPNALDIVSLRTVSALALQPDGRPLIGGLFNQVNGTPRSSLARLSNPTLAFSAARRLQHGSAGNFDVDLPATGTTGVECRRVSNRLYQLVFTFVDPVTLSGATVTSGSGFVSSIAGSGSNFLTVSLANMADTQTFTLRLNNVNDGFTIQNVSLQLGVLLGDTTGDRIVNTGDTLQTRSRAGAPVDASTFRSDVNTDGVLNTGDTLLVRSNSGASLP